MMMTWWCKKSKIKQNLIWGKPRDITTNTTNKGSRPEIHATVEGRRARLNYLIFSQHGDLLDTANKKFLLTSMAMTVCRDASKDRTY